MLVIQDTFTKQMTQKIVVQHAPTNAQPSSLAAVYFNYKTY